MANLEEQLRTINAKFLAEKKAHEKYKSKYIELQKHVDRYSDLNTNDSLGIQAGGVPYSGKMLVFFIVTTDNNDYVKKNLIVNKKITLNDIKKVFTDSLYLTNNKKTIKFLGLSDIMKWLITTCLKNDVFKTMIKNTLCKTYGESHRAKINEVMDSSNSSKEFEKGLVEFYKFPDDTANIDFNGDETKWQEIISIWE